MKRVLFILLLILGYDSQAGESVPELAIEELQEGLYLHKSYSRVDGFGLVSSNGLVIVESGSAFIVDTPWSKTDTEKLVDWIKSRGYKVIGSLSTHSHEDRTAGVAWLNSQSVPTYATALTNSILKQENKATTKFSLESDISLLADGEVEVFYPGKGHTKDNVVVWLPKYKLLFGGCFIKSLGSKTLGYVGEAFISDWPASIDKVISRYSSAKFIVPGHGGVGNVQLLEHTKNLAVSLNSRIENKQ